MVFSPHGGLNEEAGREDISGCLLGAVVQPVAGCRDAADGVYDHPHGEKDLAKVVEQGELRVAESPRGLGSGVSGAGNDGT